jgi:hypothetical protein
MPSSSTLVPEQPAITAVPKQPAMEPPNHLMAPQAPWRAPTPAYAYATPEPAMAPPNHLMAPQAPWRAPTPAYAYATPELAMAPPNHSMAPQAPTAAPSSAYAYATPAPAYAYAAPAYAAPAPAFSAPAPTCTAPAGHPWYLWHHHLQVPEPRIPTLVMHGLEGYRPRDDLQARADLPMEGRIRPPPPPVTRHMLEARPHDPKAAARLVALAKQTPNGPRDEGRKPSGGSRRNWEAHYRNALSQGPDAVREFKAEYPRPETRQEDEQFLLLFQANRREALNDLNDIMHHGW